MAYVELRHTARLLRDLASSREGHAKFGRDGESGAVVVGETVAEGEPVAVDVDVHRRADGKDAAADEELAARCDDLASEIDRGIQKFGVVDRNEMGGRVYAYEVDGYGNSNMMDDANVVRSHSRTISDDLGAEVSPAMQGKAVLNHTTRHCITMPLPCLALPCHALAMPLPCLALPCLALPCLALPSSRRPRLYAPRVPVRQPSLLSLPWLGYVSADEPTYVRTRKYILSGLTNPWFYSGTAGEGIGSPHTGPYTIWPMSIIMRALTSTDDAEIRACVAALKKAAAAPGSWLMHESFHADDAADFTRPWFAWANSLFGGLLVKLSRERPWLVGIAERKRA